MVKSGGPNASALSEAEQCVVVAAALAFGTGGSARRAMLFLHIKGQYLFPASSCGGECEK
jgi:hypothetical protein